MATVIQALNWVHARAGEHPVGKFIALLGSDNRVSVYAGNVEYHMHIPELAGLQEEGLRERLYAVGSFSKEAEVLTWTSAGFNFETPVTQRADIERLFAGQRESIQRCWMR